MLTGPAQRRDVNKGKEPKTEPDGWIWTKSLMFGVSGQGQNLSEFEEECAFAFALSKQSPPLTFHQATKSNIFVRKLKMTGGVKYAKPFTPNCSTIVVAVELWKLPGPNLLPVP